MKVHGGEIMSNGSEGTNHSDKIMSHINPNENSLMGWKTKGEGK